MAVSIGKLAILGTIMVLALTACRDGGDGAEGKGAGGADGLCPSRAETAAPQGEAPDEFEGLVERMATTLTCPGHVAHLTANAEFTFSNTTVAGAYQYWVDVERNLGRSEERSDTARERNVTIITGDARYVSSLDGGADRVVLPDCLDPPLAALGVLIDCILIGYDSTITVQKLAYRGADAIGVVARSGDAEAGDTFWSTYVLYVDPHSFAPIASSSETVSPATLDDPTPVESSVKFDYTSIEFVPADSLPADFFHPDSIGGYEEPDPLATAYAIDAPVYWLGEEFPGEGTYPPVTLVHAFPAPPELADTFPAWMTYRPSGDAPEFDITVSTYPSIEAGEDHRPQPSECLQTRSIELPEGRAVLYSLPPITPGPADDEARCRPPAEFFADVTIDDVIVKVTTFSLESENPYNSEAGIELLIRSLVRRE